MKKKVFFILSSLTAGGAERVFWLLSQNLNKELYDVSIVILNSSQSFFSLDLKDLRVIDLKTIRASKSFFKLYRLLKNEKPYAVFTTGGQINMLVGFISLFVKIPHLIARPTNVFGKTINPNRKERILGSFGKIFYRRFDKVICQSDEIKTSICAAYNLDPEKLIVIPNPVMPTDITKTKMPEPTTVKLISVARLVPQKGHDRLLDVLAELPGNHVLTIAGDGPLREYLMQKAERLGLSHRVSFVGIVKNITSLLAKHDLFVLPSFKEGFPNAVIESLSVGTPVVAFKVGGVSAIITDDFNGYIVEEDDVKGFTRSIIKASNRMWDSEAIKDDITNRFAIGTIVSNYESLLV